MESSQNIETSFHTPKGLRIYAIGDVHGHLDPLIDMHDKIAADLLESPPMAAHIVYLGDYIDRGPDSKGVLDYLIARRDRGDGIEKTFLMGNHEAACYRFLKADNPYKAKSWIKWGGQETLQSYGINLAYEDDEKRYYEVQKEFKSIIPQSHLAFKNDLEGLIQLGDYVFAHAGIHPDYKLEDQKKGHVISIREPFLEFEGTLPFCVVHGHTIAPVPEVKSHRIGIDTGLYAGGALTCAVLEESAVRFLQASQKT